MIQVFTGSNSYQIRKKLMQTEDAFVEEHGGFGIEKLDGEEINYEQILASIQSVPFLSSKKLAIIRNLSSNKQTAEQIDKLIDSADDSIELIIIEPKPDKRGIYYKTLKKRTNLQEFSELDERGLTSWLVQEAKKLEAKISPSDADYLVNRVGTSQELLANELFKLIAYNSIVDRTSIDLLSEPSPQSKIFDLLDTVFAGNTKKALYLYADQRAQKVEPQAILGLIVWQMHSVALVHSAGPKTSGEIARESGLNPYVIDKSKKIANKLTKNDLSNLLDKLCELDNSLKTQSINADEALKNLLISISVRS